MTPLAKVPLAAAAAASRAASGWSGACRAVRGGRVLEDPTALRLPGPMIMTFLLKTPVATHRALQHLAESRCGHPARGGFEAESCLSRRG